MANYGRNYNQYQPYYGGDSGDYGDQSGGYHPQAGNNPYYAPSRPQANLGGNNNSYYAPNSQPGYGYTSPNPYYAPSQPGYGYTPPNPYYSPSQPSYTNTRATYHTSAGSSHLQHTIPYHGSNSIHQDDGTASTGSISEEDQDGGGGGDYPAEVEEWNDGTQTSGFNRTMLKPKGKTGQQSRPNPKPRGNPVSSRSRVSSTGPPMSTRMANPRPARRR